MKKTIPLTDKFALVAAGITGFNFISGTVAWQFHKVLTEVTIGRILNSNPQAVDATIVATGCLLLASTPATLGIAAGLTGQTQIDSIRKARQHHESLLANNKPNDATPS